MCEIQLKTSFENPNWDGDAPDLSVEEFEHIIQFSPKGITQARFEEKQKIEKMFGKMHLNTSDFAPQIQKILPFNYH